MMKNKPTYMKCRCGGTSFFQWLKWKQCARCYEPFIPQKQHKLVEVANFFSA